MWLCKRDLSKECEGKHRDCTDCILDKIRKEITNIPITDTDGHNNNWYREPQAIINDVLQIIDEYKAESEET